MAYRKKTLRSIPETTRKLARLLNELESTARRIRNLIPEIQRLEREAEAFMKASEIMKVKDAKPKRKPVPPESPGPLFEEHGKNGQLSATPLEVPHSDDDRDQAA